VEGLIEEGAQQKNDADKWHCDSSILAMIERVVSLCYPLLWNK
jgi:hypothetical protein